MGFAFTQEVMISPVITFFKIFLSLLIYVETETVQVGEGQKERERESQAGSTLSVQSLMRGWNSQNHRFMT